MRNSTQQLALVAALATAMLPGLSAAQTASLHFKNSASATVAKLRASEKLDHYQAVRLLDVDLAGIKSELKQAPAEGTVEAQVMPKIIALPTPDGRTERFKVFEYSIMTPELAAQMPFNKTYRGQGLDNPSDVAVLDTTSLGFHAMVISAKGSYFVEPLSLNPQGTYGAFYHRDMIFDAPWTCQAKENPIRQAESLIPGGGGGDATGTTLRTFRLALNATGEYSAVFGGTVPGAQAAMVTAVNRVSGVYEVDFAYRLNMVSNNPYTNAAGDPFTNNNGSTMLSQNQTVCDSTPGSANYDIGHVFSTGGGGVAFLGVVGVNGSKAGGVTGLPSPVGDAFYIDYVAHEMGHQFGGNHTFNSTSGSCGGGNRAASAAYEPGSGSTIMAYAGICSPQDLQSNSDPYFHVKSYDEITASINSKPTVGTSTATGNTIPVPDAGTNYTIPYGTPYILTGSGSDANGDTLTYCWEQFNLGSTTSATNLASGVINRSYNPTTSPKRFVPPQANVLANTTNTWDATPGSTRSSITWRMTVRDNRAGGGGSDYRQIVLTVSGTPLSVTSPNTAVSWTGGTTQTVTWTPGTGPATNVDIYLSTNGGASFYTGTATLLGTFPNSGSANVTIPNTPTSTARIFVKANNNIYYDVSNVNFTITAGNTAPTITTIPTQNINEEAPFVYNATANDPDSGQTKTWSLDSGPNGLAINPSTGQITWTPTEAQGPNNYSVTIRVTDNGSPNLSDTETFTINVAEVAKTVAGTITLESWIPDPAGQPLTVLISPTDAAGAIETKNLTLGAGGTFSFDSQVAPGTYNIYADGDHYLRKLVGSFTIASTGVSGVNATLLNGDCDGDGVISVFDYGIVSDAFDSVPESANWNAAADLDGDGVVSVFDYGIMSNNFDKTDDN